MLEKYILMKSAQRTPVNERTDRSVEAGTFFPWEG